MVAFGLNHCGPASPPSGGPLRRDPSGGSKKSIRDLARLGFVLFGLYLVIGPLTAMGSYVRFSDPDGARFSAFLISLAFWALFGLLPGAYLIVRNRALTIYLFPAQTDESFDVGAFVTALVCVLGVYLVIRGIGDVVAGLFLLAVLSQYSLETMARPIEDVVTALLLMVAGIFLAARAQHVARLFYRPGS